MKHFLLTTICAAMSVAALAAGSADKSESRISRAPYRMEAPKAGRALK